MNPSKNTFNHTIGWAVCTAHVLNKQEVELHFTETEPVESFKRILDKRIIYPNKNVVKCFFVKGKKRPVSFQKTKEVFNFLDNQEYVLLLNFYEEKPIIKGANCKYTFDKIWNGIWRDVTVKYRVKFPKLLKQVTDTLDRIIYRMILEFKEDPANILISSEAEWEILIGDTYCPVKTPPLPYSSSETVVKILNALDK